MITTYHVTFNTVNESIYYSCYPTLRKARNAAKKLLEGRGEKIFFNVTIWDTTPGGICVEIFNEWKQD